MGWKDGLLTEQEKAAGHTGGHARLLAGPGTGKTLTLTRRIRFLVEEKKASPDSIRAFTFTRAAAKELDQRVRSDLNHYQGGMCILGRLTMTASTPRHLISPLGPNWVGTDSAV